MNWPQTCAGMCQGSIQFGMYYGKYCWCGSIGEDALYGKYDEEMEMDRCNLECPGDETEMCGGGMGMSMYKFGGLAIEGEMLRRGGYGYYRE